MTRAESMGRGRRGEKDARFDFELPNGYYLERDPDVLVVRRLDGSMVGAFSARGATTEAVERTIEETARSELSGGREVPAAVHPALRARFFGHFELLCDEEPVPLGRNGKALSILKYLLANRSRPVSQDHLMGWLWPESSLKKARWSLNSAIYGLRKHLGSCRPPMPRPACCSRRATTA